MKDEFKKLLWLEVRSVRANLWPMMVLWVLAGASVALYYLVPSVAESLKVFADIQVKYGKLASFINRVICGGVLPGIFLLAMPSIRPKRPVATVVSQALWCGLMGVLVDIFFALQVQWFGSEPSLAVSIKKTLADQFGFCILIVSPLNAVFYAWVGNAFSFKVPAGMGYLEWFAKSYMSNILMNWCISIPTLIAVYAFPPELQITVSGFVCAVWVLLAIFIGHKVSTED